MKGLKRWVIPEMEFEIENIIKENNLKGRGARTFAQKKIVEDAKIGKEIDRIYRSLSFLGVKRNKR